MNSNLSAIPQQPSHGGPEALREFIHETLWTAYIQIEIGSKCALIGDDAMLELAIRRLLSCTKALVETLGDLNALKRREVSND